MSAPVTPGLGAIPTVLTDRHLFIGGSEAFELLNERQYGKGCVRALAYRKSQIKPDFPERVPLAERDEAMRGRGVLLRGKEMENLAARFYMEDTGRNLIRTPGKVRRHPEYPGAGVHVDRMIVGTDDYSTGDAEIKTHDEGPFLNILRNGLPPGHNLQLQWAMFITGHRWGAFIILGVFGGLPLKHFDVLNDATIGEIFKRELDKFWSTLAKNELPPPPFPADDGRCKVCPWRLTCRGELIDQDELLNLMAEAKGKKRLTPIQNDELDHACEDRALILSEIEALDHDSDDEEKMGALQLVNRRIRELIGDQDALLVNHRWSVTSSDGIWSGLDQSRLKQEKPELYKDFFISRRPTGRKRITVTAVGKEKSR
jgi:hypothetical protein